MECRHGKHDQLNVYQAIHNHMLSIYLQVYGLFVFMCLDEKMCSEANAFLSMFPVSHCKGSVATPALFEEHTFSTLVLFQSLCQQIAQCISLVLL